MSLNANRRFSTVAVALAVLVIPTVARAHGGNADSNVVHACIGNVSKIVRIVGVSGTCIASPPVLAETAAHWDIQGKQGAAGINGTSGANGINGANGAPGTNGTNGIDGTNGTNGTNGIDGKDGANSTHADPPCFDNTNRYVDCGNGTVTDTVTGLIWLTDAACLGSHGYVTPMGRPLPWRTASAT